MLGVHRIRKKSSLPIVTTMWIPTKLKSNQRHVKPNAGWYCLDTVSQAADPTTRFSGKQSAQKECNRRNKAKLEAQTDGKTRNIKKWFTVGYTDHMGNLVEDAFQNNPIQYHGYMNALLHQTVETMQGGYISGAVVAIIWPGQLSRHAAVYNQRALPIHHVFADGRITGPTP